MLFALVHLVLRRLFLLAADAVAVDFLAVDFLAVDFLAVAVFAEVFADADFVGVELLAALVGDFLGAVGRELV